MKTKSKITKSNRRLKDLAPKKNPKGGLLTSSDLNAIAGNLAQSTPAGAPVAKYGIRPLTF